MAMIDKNGNESKWVIFWRDFFPPNALIFAFTIVLGIIILGFIGDSTAHDDGWCDYDSCSQKAEEWNYSGENCFNSQIEQCEEFLALWNECQENKKELGIC